ncbi:hypothetical protein H4W30_000674 [Amycolatopsis roodepoortensis]|uniref:Ribosome-binding factor A n=1 Tax=Amycolatopsis roodepoortensis TaxID=700274 RepID=A0ABR9KZT6_9PSEU|nr:hypothetical protein [Amycolatopsis roodepoortensis]
MNPATGPRVPGVRDDIGRRVRHLLDELIDRSPQKGGLV